MSPPHPQTVPLDELLAVVKAARALLWTIDNGQRDVGTQCEILRDRLAELDDKS